MGSKWCCSGFREPESKVYADPDGCCSSLTDVRQFVEESNLHVEVGAEMEAVADTFRGVENLNGVFNWEKPDGLKEFQREWRQTKVVESCEKDLAIRASLVLKDADPECVHSECADGVTKPNELHRKRFLNLFWKIRPQKACNKNAVELIEFARDGGNEDVGDEEFRHCDLTNPST